jgi:hypothetical protein
MDRQGSFKSSPVPIYQKATHSLQEKFALFVAKWSWWKRENALAFWVFFANFLHFEFLKLNSVLFLALNYYYNGVKKGFFSTIILSGAQKIQALPQGRRYSLAAKIFTFFFSPPRVRWKKQENKEDSRAGE